MLLVITFHYCPNVDRRFQFSAAYCSAIGSLRVMKSVAGKGEAKGHSLPVVAMGSIPHIYRRDSFSHRATPERLPHKRSREGFY